MEKTHHWVYVRSKNNGRRPGSLSAASPEDPSISSVGAATSPGIPSTSSGVPSVLSSGFMSAQVTPPTPAMPTPHSDSTDLSTPGSGLLPSPNDPFLTSWNDQTFSFNDPPVVNAPDFTLYPSTFLDDAALAMDMEPYQDFFNFPIDCDFTSMDVLPMFQSQDFMDTTQEFFDPTSQLKF
jgi:hypothetical protein